MDDIVIEKSKGLFWVEGGPVLLGRSFPSAAQAMRFARAQAGQSGTIILKGDEK